MHDGNAVVFGGTEGSSFQSKQIWSSSDFCESCDLPALLSVHRFEHSSLDAAAFTSVAWGTAVFLRDNQERPDHHRWCVASDALSSTLKTALPLSLVCAAGGDSLNGMTNEVWATTASGSWVMVGLTCSYLWLHAQVSVYLRCKPITQFLAQLSLLVLVPVLAAQEWL